jgi:hypothetical protein
LVDAWAKMPPAQRTQLRTQWHETLKPLYAELAKPSREKNPPVTHKVDTGAGSPADSHAATPKVPVDNKIFREAVKALVTKAGGWRA